MTWLIWKDYRLNRPIWIVALGLFLASYLGVAILAWCEHGQPVPGQARADRYLGVASFLSLAIGQLTLAFIAGNSIATERVDRSADFLASLPVSRRRLLASKLLVVLGLAAFVWIPNLVVLAIVSEGFGAPPGKITFVLDNIATTGLTFFCVAWLCSAILSSPTFSVCISLLTPYAAILCITYAVLRFSISPGNLHAEAAVFAWYHGFCLTLSAVCFLVGTLYYLRRTEP